MIEINVEEFVLKTRKDMRISQTDFGKLLGVTRTAVNHWEKGVSFPNKQNWELIVAFSEIKHLPDAKDIKKAMLVKGSSYALYIVLKARFENRNIK